MPVRKVGNLCYEDKHIQIGYDNLQWIVVRGKTHYYYPTMEMLLTEGLQYEVREIIGTDIKTLLATIHTAQKYLEHVARNIKVPGGKYGN